MEGRFVWDWESLWKTVAMVTGRMWQVNGQCCWKPPSLSIILSKRQYIHGVTQEGEAGSERHWLFPHRQGHLLGTGEKTVRQGPENTGQGLRVFRGKRCLREYRMSPGSTQIQLGWCVPHYLYCRHSETNCTVRKWGPEVKSKKMGSQTATAMEVFNGQEAEVIAISMMILAQVYTEEREPHRGLQGKKSRAGTKDWRLW